MSVDIETFKEIWAQFMYEGSLTPGYSRLWRIRGRNAAPPG
jgi:hypothetical protein